MTLSEAVILFREKNDSESGKRVLEESYRLANSIISNKFSGFGYSEDLFSEAHDTIVDCIRNFNPDFGKFSTYCYKSIYNNLISYIKKKGKFLAEYPCSQKLAPVGDEEMKDLLNIVLSIGEVHYNSLLYGVGSKWVKCRAKKKLLKKLKDEGFIS